MHNPTVGAIFRQTYIRQVFEELVDQKGYIKAFYHGYGTEVCGPIPGHTQSEFGQLQSSYERSCPFAYNPKKAASTLKSHGWNVVKGGVDTCARPGTGSSRCGGGIAKGAQLEFNYVYATGNQPAVDSIVAQASDSEQVGIKFNLSGTTTAGILSTLVACTATQPSCKWQIANLAGSFGFYPNFYPVSSSVFETGGGENTDNYSNATMDRLIGDVPTSIVNPLGALYRYEDFATKQLPLIWQQKGDYEVSAVSDKLHGFTPNLILNVLPSEWSLSN